MSSGYRIGKVTRGKNRAYVLVKNAGQRRSHVRAYAADDTWVPVAIEPVEGADGEWMLAVPPSVRKIEFGWYSAAKKVRVPTYQEDGGTRLGRLRSWARNLGGHDTTTSVLEADAKSKWGCFDITVDRVVREKGYDPSASDETIAPTAFTHKVPVDVDIIQGEARYVGNDDRILADDKVCIWAADEEGRVISAHMVNMRDSVHEDPTSGAKTRAIQFSLRIPTTVPSCVLWVLTHVGADSIYAMSPDELGHLRTIWFLLTERADQNPEYGRRFAAEWVPSPGELERQRNAVLSQRPTFSVVVPLRDATSQMLHDSISSVLAQSYADLELLLVHAGPLDELRSRAVAPWAQRDGRVSLVPTDDGASVVASVNAGIRASSGDAVCFLECGDTLSPDALFRFAQALEGHPTTDLWYSDEDYVENGLHVRPWFKPDWEPDYLLGTDYTRHFLAVRKSVLNAMDLPGEELGDAWAHALALGASEAARNVYHSRRVLYHVHQRAVVAPPVRACASQALDEHQRAVQAHLDRIVAKAIAQPSPRMPGCLEVAYDLVDRPLVSIVIPNKDAVPVLDCCLKSLRVTVSYDNYEVVIIENNSCDPQTSAYYEQAEADDARVRVVHYEGGFNFARIMNFGVEHARGDYLLLLNNDIEAIAEGWLERMLSVCQRPSTGIVGAKLLYPDDTVQHGGVLMLAPGPCHANQFLPKDTVDKTLQLMQDMYAVTAACLLVRRCAFEDVGGMDPAFAVDYNDVDFCWRVHDAGYQVVYDPAVELYHYESVSRGVERSPESQHRFERELALLHEHWAQRKLIVDPARNPSLEQRSPYYKLNLLYMGDE